jgi:hypothetical protein
MIILEKMLTSYHMFFTTITVSLQDLVSMSIMKILFRMTKTLMYTMLLKKLKICSIIWMIDLNTILLTIFLYFLVAILHTWMLIIISTLWTTWSTIWTNIIQTNTFSNIQLQVNMLMPYKNMMLNGPPNMMT